MPNTLTEAICALICVEPNTHAAHTHTPFESFFLSLPYACVCVCRAFGEIECESYCKMGFRPL